MIFIRFRLTVWHIRIVITVPAEAACISGNIVKIAIFASLRRFRGSVVCGICLMYSRYRRIWNGSESWNGSAGRDMMLLNLRGDKMNVLVACEESQVVCKAFRQRGHNAFSCDIQDCSGGLPEYHIKSDVLPLLNGNCVFITCDGSEHYIKDSWDMIIAFPPCTYLSNAGNGSLMRGGKLNLERYNKGLAAKDFFLSIYNSDCNRICIENPVHNRIFDMPPFSQEIQPFYFGHPVSKKTRLWLKGLPVLWASDYVVCLDSWLPGSNKNCGKGVCSSNKSIDRSKTFPGIAEAMAAQWG